MGHTYALLQVVEITVHESYMRTATRSDVETHDQPTYEHDRISPIFVFGARKAKGSPPRAHSESPLREGHGPCMAPHGGAMCAMWLMRHGPKTHGHAHGHVGHPMLHAHGDGLPAYRVNCTELLLNYCIQ